MKRTRVIDANFAIKAALPGPLQTPLRSALMQWRHDEDTMLPDVVPGGTTMVPTPLDEGA